MAKSYKYEFNLAVVQYLQRAVESQQVRGEQQAKDLVSILDLLRVPTNAEELEKENLETLKAKYEPVTGDAKPKKASGK